MEKKQKINKKQLVEAYFRKYLLKMDDIAIEANAEHDVIAFEGSEFDSVFMEILHEVYKFGFYEGSVYFKEILQHNLENLQIKQKEEKKESD